MARIFLIRHGEPAAAWGEHEDPCLSERGRAEVEVVAAKLARHAPFRVLSSPMTRCRESAELLTKRLGNDPILEDRVSEVPTPADVGDRRAWLQENFPWRGGREPTRWVDMHADLRKWRSDLIHTVRDWDEDHAVFTHFIAINALVGCAENKPETIVFRPHFGSVTELVAERGRLRVVKLGAQMEDGDVL